MTGMRTRALVLAACATAALGSTRDGRVQPDDRTVDAVQDRTHWIGAWATAPQRSVRPETFAARTLRLIVHVTAGGGRARIRLSNTFGTSPVTIGAAHIARRTNGVAIDTSSDRTLTFERRPSVKIAAGASVVSDPVALDVPPLSDAAISLFLPENTEASTSHALALQTSYVAAAEGDETGATTFSIGRSIDTWPFLTGLDVEASARGASLVAFGSSTTDGDGSTLDANRRWPDILAERLQREGISELGVLNEGIIGNRLLEDLDSPGQRGGPFEATLLRLGPELGEAGVKRFDRDVVDQPGVRFVVLALGINDILFPGAFTPLTDTVRAERLIAANRKLVERAHKKGIRVIETTIPPFEGALFRKPSISFSTPEKERVRQEVNAWIRTSRDFDAVVDFDEAVRDPDHPVRLRPSFDSGDHLHVNDAGNVAQANAFSLAVFRQ